MIPSHYLPCCYSSNIAVCILPRHVYTLKLQLKVKAKNDVQIHNHTSKLSHCVMLSASFEYLQTHIFHAGWKMCCYIRGVFLKQHHIACISAS